MSDETVDMSYGYERDGRKFRIEIDGIKPEERVTVTQDGRQVFGQTREASTAEDGTDCITQDVPYVPTRTFEVDVTDLDTGKSVGRGSIHMRPAEHGMREPYLYPSDQTGRCDDMLDKPY